MSEYMIFCLGDGRLKSEGDGYQKNNRVFNKDVSHEEYKEIRDNLPKIKLKITEWINQDDGGYLKTRNYEDAWALWWNGASKDDKQAILDIKYFDKDIFKEITGIDVDDSNDSKKQELLNEAQELINQAKKLKKKAKEL